MKLRPEQLRILENAAVAYDAWLQASHQADLHAHRLEWKRIDGVEYLYRHFGRSGAQSLGRRNAETESLKQVQDLAKPQIEQALAELRERLVLIAAEYRAHRLPRVHPILGRICREADRRSLLGSALLVVGTNAMPAYEFEAQDRFAIGLETTEDCDFAWCRQTQMTVAGSGATPFYSLLKSVDSTFTPNYERPFQARNAAAYEVELLLAPSLKADFPASEPIRPIPLPEQEWLLQGRRLAHVVFDMNNQPVRLVVPDPRWMALHKLWLSEKPERNRNKKPKDGEQGRRLLLAVQESMPHYPLDDAFLREVPDELRRYLS
jgi:hypothetical protein